MQKPISNELLRNQQRYTSKSPLRDLTLQNHQGQFDAQRNFVQPESFQQQSIQLTPNRKTQATGGSNNLLLPQHTHLQNNFYQRNESRSPMVQNRQQTGQSSGGIQNSKVLCQQPTSQSSSNIPLKPQIFSGGVNNSISQQTQMNVSQLKQNNIQKQNSEINVNKPSDEKPQITPATQSPQIQFQVVPTQMPAQQQTLQQQNIMQQQQSLQVPNNQNIQNLQNMQNIQNLQPGQAKVLLSLTQNQSQLQQQQQQQMQQLSQHQSIYLTMQQAQQQQLQLVNDQNAKLIEQYSSVKSLMSRQGSEKENLQIKNFQSVQMNNIMNSHSKTPRQSSSSLPVPQQSSPQKFQFFESPDKRQFFYSFGGQDLEVKLKVLQTENETLNKIVQERGKELQDLKKNEANLQRMIEENQKLNQIIKELETDKQNSNLKLIQQANDISRMNECYNQEMQEKENMKQIEIDQALSDKNSKIKQIEEKVQLLIKENERLNSILNQRINNNEDTMIQQQMKLNQEFELNRVNQDNNQLKLMLQSKEKELLDTQEVLKDFDQKIGILLEENEKLNQFISDQEQKKGELENKMNSICGENEKIMSILNENEENNKNEYQDQQMFLQQNQDRIKFLESEYANKEYEVNLLEEKTNQLLNENEQLSQINEERVQDIINLRLKLEEIEQEKHIFEEQTTMYQNQNKEIVNQNEILGKLSIDRLKEIERMTKDNLSLNQRLILIETQLDSLKRLKYELDRDKMDATKKMNNLQNQLLHQQQCNNKNQKESLIQSEKQQIAQNNLQNNSNNSNSSNNNNQSGQNQQQQSEYNHQMERLQLQIEEWKNIAEFTQKELNRKNNELIEKEEELGQIKAQVYQQIQ